MLHLSPTLQHAAHDDPSARRKPLKLVFFAKLQILQRADLLTPVYQQLLSHTDHMFSSV